MKEAESGVEEQSGLEMELGNLPVDCHGERLQDEGLLEEVVEAVVAGTEPPDMFEPWS